MRHRSKVYGRLSAQSMGELMAMVAKSLIERFRDYNAVKLIESIKREGVRSDQTLEYLRRTVKFSDNLPQVVQMVRDKLSAEGLR